MKNLSFFSREEQDIASELNNNIDLSSSKNILTNFLTVLESNVLKKLAGQYNISKLEFFGGFEDAERVRAKVIVNEYYDISYNIVCLSSKFNSKFHSIKHKDVLGAVHNLGINYNRIGDIIVDNEQIFIFVDEQIASYIMLNLSRIGKAILNFEIIDNLENITITKEYKSTEIVASSFRLDIIVAKITNKSRSKVKEFLQKDYIKLNHIVINNGEKTCSVGDVISIRKYGRFVLKDFKQNNKTLKYRITVDKLV
ncbi:RNA-binding protein [Gemella sp. GH3]|uniref:YlmH/Sll1252 family protein n=1 Tax=unclassified Gemella TaxID=2624949 RepID=UPI0015CFF922|nr:MULTISPECIES: YlmH/Sll1252 family protein [unclassified Gemella]MBF0713623.1 RNA-binding protein [Gemella sp. GH3.1]NYS50575.1 RNA-binding protein [Gemella sp. GH3]